MLDKTAVNALTGGHKGYRGNCPEADKNPGISPTRRHLREDVKQTRIPRQAENAGKKKRDKKLQKQKHHPPKNQTGGGGVCSGTGRGSQPLKTEKPVKG